jgi:hypothetical protein
MLHFVTLVRTDVSYKRIASIIKVIKIGERGTTLAVASNRTKILIFLRSVLLLLVTASVGLALKFLPPWRWRRYFPPKRLFLQDPQVVTSQKAAFFSGALFFSPDRCLLSARDKDMGYISYKMLKSIYWTVEPIRI